MTNRRPAVVAWSGSVSTVAAAFAGIVASQTTTSTLRNPWFVASLSIALLAFVVLMCAGIPDFAAWILQRKKGSHESVISGQGLRGNRSLPPSADAVLIMASGEELIQQPLRRLSHEIRDVPARNPQFVGRDQLLVKLRERLRFSDSPKAHVIRGLSGIGKTQFAIEYAHRFAASYDLVWWVAAGEAALIGDQLIELGVQLGCARPGTDAATAAKATMAELRSRGRWLLIFDDADNPQDVDQWLAGCPTGHVLITSRSGGWDEIAKTVELREFDRAESTRFIREWVPTVTPQDADRLANDLGDLPLGVAQAAQYMAITGMPADEYIQLLGERVSDLMDEGKPLAYKLSLAAVIRQTFDQVCSEDPSYSEFAALCAFLAPEPIPLTMFAKAGDCIPALLAQSVVDPIAFRRMLRALDRHGLARLDGERLQMHRLAQAILRDFVLNGQSVMKTAENVLVMNDPGDPTDPANWSGWAGILPHVLALSSLTTGGDNFRDLIIQANSYLLVRGDIRASNKLADRLRSEWYHELGADDLYSMRISCNLAEGLRGIGNFDEARKLYEETLSRSRNNFGENHATTLRAADGLAITLHERHEIRLAQRLFESTFARRRELLGSDHPDTLTSATNLANHFLMLGETQKARELHEDTLVRRKRVLGNDHPGTLRTAQMLATDLSAAREWEEARRLYENTLRRMQSVLGEDHPDTLMCAQNLAAVLKDLGEMDAAATLGEATLQRRRITLGNDHPHTLDNAANLAVLLLEMDEPLRSRRVASVFEESASAMSDNGEFYNLWAFCMLPYDPRRALDLLARASSLGMDKMGVVIGNRLYCFNRLGLYTEGLDYAVRTTARWGDIANEALRMWAVNEDPPRVIHTRAHPYILDLIEVIVGAAGGRSVDSDWKTKLRNLRRSE